MDKNGVNFDWGLLQSFLAIAETGSLSGAAQKLGLSQPTLGRHVRALEDALGVELFHRHARGLVPTEAGHRLLPKASDIRDSAAGLAMTAAGAATNLRGTVRITASNVISHYTLPSIIAEIRAAEPDIEIELAPTDAIENLLYREADIAVRMVRPTQLDVITQHIGDIRLGLFATQVFLDAHGRPKTPADLMNFSMVGYDRADQIVEGFRAMGLDVDRDFFKVRCDHQAVYVELVKAGAGLGFMQLRIGRSSPDLVQVLPDLPLPTLPIWLAAPEALRSNPRIRRVFDLLAKGLQEVCDA